MNDLDKLKNLLFGDEKESLDSIKERVERPETRACDVADILPEAVYQSHRNGDHLAVSLREPVGECIEQAIHENPKKFGDALYPVMGPAIRRSIMEALRGIAQQINEAVEQSLTPQGLKWRFGAWRAGVPFGDYVLQQTLLYRVEQAYLIDRDSGLLMGHAHHAAVKIKDSDAVSAMFTAIQDFVKESFSPDRSGRLETADMGEFTLWAVHGPHAVLACVIRGVPPKGLRSDLSGILERVHFRYGDGMREFSGDASELAGVEEELEECLKLEARQNDDKENAAKLSPSMIILLLLLAVALGYAGYVQWREYQRVSQFTRALKSTPGYFVDAVESDGERMSVSGMRDPLAPSPQAVAESIGLSPDKVTSAMQPFQSLAPELIAIRAARRLDAPPGVEFDVQDEILVVSGPSSVAWRRRVAAATPYLSGIDTVVYSTTDDDRRTIVEEWLAPPGTVSVTVVDDSNVELAGVAPGLWLAQVNTAIDEAALEFSIDASAVRREERVQLEQDVASFGEANFFFAEGVLMAADQDDALPAFIDQLASLRNRAEAERLNVVLVLTGFTDSVGDNELNRQLAANRTAVVADRLIASGHRSELIERRQQTADDRDGSVVDFNLRRVSVILRLDAADAD